MDTDTSEQTYHNYLQFDFFTNLLNLSMAYYKLENIVDVGRVPDQGSSTR